MGPFPDGSNDHNHASIKTVIKLGVRVWEEQGIESAEKMYSAEDVTEEGQREVSFLPPKHSLLLAGRQWLEMRGRAADAFPHLEPCLFGQFADHSDEGAIFIFQSLVVRFQFC